ncbi:putative PKHD-type hydroxylase [Raphanus sativus]|uniref:2-oxoglutarate and iron-dependent oxygenase domain-containing protein ICU11-like n=1 Tax=Raphanus sativus TaxID=3726 RepID=A0A6J0JLV4_RAPSA|nr:2-oxoglutarate and iron-dependent oxygenase domain-containing protein ICU11-like [Raphanus sativus]KAJ4889666.1 putative PKHD-type hydroxylase [Raphanus sativus]
MALDQQQPQASLESDEQIQIQEYKERVLSSYQRLHGEIYSLDPASFFVPSFLKAVTPNSEENLKSIMVQSAPGIYTFEMLQPKFCEMLLEEVLHIEKWAHDSKSLIRRPGTLNTFGVVLDDFGFESMLQKLLEDFISPISQVLFPEVCGSGLDSHHGYVVEYGEYRETDHVAYHMDDSEVTLNVCLGKDFSGGELYFRGVRCANHMDSEIGEEEHYDYPNVPGHAVLHRGSHRHGAKAITSGIRANLIMWCRSSTFRATTSSRKDFPRWCAKCRVDRHNSKRPE